MKKVCGLDVYNNSIFCAIYNGENDSGVKEFSTMTPDIYSMGEYLQFEEVEEVCLESTGIYWIAVWDLLYEMGFNLTLVNPYFIKQAAPQKEEKGKPKYLKVRLLL
ncbi:MAG: hypothetical protein PHT18_11610 [Proteiniphilum sp.]|nr:hypothetical protein [Proteiniphilum sp.]